MFVDVFILSFLDDSLTLVLFVLIFVVVVVSAAAVVSVIFVVRLDAASVAISGASFVGLEIVAISSGDTGIHNLQLSFVLQHFLLVVFNSLGFVCNVVLFLSGFSFNPTFVDFSINLNRICTWCLSLQFKVQMNFLASSCQKNIKTSISSNRIDRGRE